MWKQTLYIAKSDKYIGTVLYTDTILYPFQTILNLEKKIEKQNSEVLILCLLWGILEEQIQI